MRNYLSDLVRALHHIEISQNTSEFPQLRELVYVGHVPAASVDPFGSEYTYLQVANEVARRIGAGEITEKLPSKRTRAEEYGVAYTTVRHAMDVLRQHRADHHRSWQRNVRDAEQSLTRCRRLEGL